MVPLSLRFAALRQLCTWATGAALLALTACGGGGGGQAATPMGTMRIGITDAPACGYDEVNVTVQRVRVHQSGTAEANDAGWQELTLSPARRIDLLSLTNGVFQELGTLSLPAGSYTQVRLVLAANNGNTPLANAIRLTGVPGEIALTTPSGQQSGLKINTNVTVGANQVADLMLDFDACKSVVLAGSSGQYVLKPVITAIPLFAAAGNAVQGYVDPALAGATVSLQAGGVPVRATVPSSGVFVLSPVPAGTYDLVLVAPNRASAVLTGVPVSDTSRTTVASSGTPLALPGSASRTAAGAVTFTGSSAIPDGTVRALQILTGGPTIEWTARQVDPSNGSYSFSLPIAAPGRAAYAAGATGYSFTADAPVAAHYTLQALVPGKANQSADIDLTSANATANFAFTP